jgi:hypothetical protein
VGDLLPSSSLHGQAIVKQKVKLFSVLTIFESYAWAHNVEDDVCRGARPPISGGFPEEFATLMQACWHQVANRCAFECSFKTPATKRSLICVRLPIRWFDCWLLIWSLTKR